MQNLRCYFARALSLVGLCSCSFLQAETDAIFAERNGLVAVEAEHFFKQTETEKRAFCLTTETSHPDVTPDGDPPHVAGASGGAYVEVLPDTRRTHADKLISGTNFSPRPGKMAVLHYRVHFSQPGRYYVWARAYSTGSEDNGLHVGLDGNWPESGQRLQWCEGKQTWRWESKQRTEQQHCGEPHKIYLDVQEAGLHTIQFSMREDGFEFDKWLMTTNRDLERPIDVGPASIVHSGQMPPVLPFVPANETQVAASEVEDLSVRTATPATRQALTALVAMPNADKNQVELTGSPTTPLSSVPLIEPRQPDGKGEVKITGELKQWHKVTLTLNGPYAHEQDNAPNPFTDYRMNVKFTHSDGTTYTIPAYFAADGDAANSSAESGTQWRAHFAPDRTGRWKYEVTFERGEMAALGSSVAAKSVAPFHGKSGSFSVVQSDKSGRDLRGQGRLAFVGERYLRFAGSKEYFLKAGADAPETLLGYVDFDNTIAGKAQKVPLKTWAPHVRDWTTADPTWKSGKGKGLIGAVNYLSSKGCNAFSFLTYNAGGDGDNVWPFIHRNDKMHYDCSKLDQWGIVFDHGTSKGMYLHFKMQENETDDNRAGDAKTDKMIPESLDGGALGPQRKLYCRELVARYAHNLALNWNLGEENTQSTAEQKAMLDYLAEIDAYQHNRVVHTFPNQQDAVYKPLVGDQSKLTGLSLQNSHIKDTHWQTVKWVEQSTASGKPWVVAFDESGTAAHGQCPDTGYEGYDGHDKGGNYTYTENEVRKQTLWGTLMGGGAGVEYYFGYQYVQNDLVCEDWRSRDRSWDYCRIALEFFDQQKIPFWNMKPSDELIGNSEHDNSKYCLAKADEIYVVYLPSGGTTNIDLSKATGQFKVQWFNPRSGGELAKGSVANVSGGASVSVGNPPKAENAVAGEDDWVAVLRR